MSDDLLDDLENLVSDDWQKVHEEFKRKEYKEEISKPVIPDFPTFEEFYRLMTELVTEQYLHPMVAELAHRFIRNRDRESIPAFEKVWSFFTDPRRYDLFEERCGQCGRDYVVIYERKMMPRVSIRMEDMWSHERTMKIKSEVVHCIWCSTPIATITGTVVGVMSNGRNDETKLKSGDYF
jgi:hypothetical protein